MRSRIVHIVVLGALLLSCNLFDTRDPENPVADNQTLPPANTPADVLSNFKKAFNQKNIQEYEKLFADTALHGQEFVFVPNQSASSRYAVIFSSWDKNAESEYFRNIVAAVGEFSPLEFVTTSQEVFIQRASDSAKYTFDYQLTVPHNRSDLKTELFVGRCEISMSPDKNTHTIWRINQWIDFETKKDSSWSELKGQFSK